MVETAVIEDSILDGCVWGARARALLPPQRTAAAAAAAVGG